MTALTIQDLQEVYGDTINQFPFETFNSLLEKIIIENKLIPSYIPQVER